MIVSFSGIDSAGKTTQIDLLYGYCKSSGVSVKKVWSKARGTPGVLLLKQLVRRDKKMNTEEKAEYRKNVFESPRKQKLLYVASPWCIPVGSPAARRTMRFGSTAKA